MTILCVFSVSFWIGFNGTRYESLPQICGISVLFGDYEKSLKEPRGGALNPLFVVTDREDLLNRKKKSSWTPIRMDPTLWKEDCVRFEGARNNPCNNTNPFNLGKFFKTQFYRLPFLQEAGCNVVIWLDGTIRINDITFMGHMASRARRGQNFVVYTHQRKGSVHAEARASNYGKYNSRVFAGKPQPPQPVMEQYQHYLAQGFRERWFGDGHGEEYGLYVTCMVMFDLRQPITKEFLDCWWEESVRWTTQDQVSFPYCAWKLGVQIHALPDLEADGTFQTNSFFTKLRHGK
jgi:hypothetical protein